MVKNAKQAIDLYKKLFNVEVVSHQPFSKEMGEQMGLPKDFDYDNSTIHAELKLLGNTLYMSDNTSMTVGSGGCVDVLVEIDSLEEINRIYQQVEKTNQKISQKLEKTFWGAYFARFIDNFGVGWQLNYTIPPEQIEAQKPATSSDKTTKKSSKSPKNPSKKSSSKKSSKKKN